MATKYGENSPLFRAIFFQSRKMWRLLVQRMANESILALDYTDSIIGDRTSESLTERRNYS
jgi:hypothetical protein